MDPESEKRIPPKQMKSENSQIGIEALSKITEAIIGFAYRVSNTLGVGFIEKVYENALAHELRKAGHQVEQQQPIQIYYDGVEVGFYKTDLLVDGVVAVEIKMVYTLVEAHFLQCLNFMKASKIGLGLVLNFGTPKIGIKRIINSNI